MDVNNFQVGSLWKRDSSIQWDLEKVFLGEKNIISALSPFTNGIIILQLVRMIKLFHTFDEEY